MVRDKEKSKVKKLAVSSETHALVKNAVPYGMKMTQFADDLLILALKMKRMLPEGYVEAKP